MITAQDARDQVQRYIHRQKPTNLADAQALLDEHIDKMSREGFTSVVFEADPKLFKELELIYQHRGFFVDIIENEHLVVEW